MKEMFGMDRESRSEGGGGREGEVAGNDVTKH